MTKTQKNSDTLTQLRGLMHRHTQTQAEAQPRPVVVTNVTTLPAATPIAQRTPASVRTAIVHERFTVRLNAPELARLGEIVLATHQRIGQRITPTDVLRVGLGRVGDNAPITAAEITTLRATDARRNRPQASRAGAQ